MDLDTRYSLTRDRLYTLGFEQPLPIGSLAIVTALLDEIVQTSNNLKHAQESNKQLQEVGVDNSFQFICCPVQTNIFFSPNFFLHFTRIINSKRLPGNLVLSHINATIPVYFLSATHFIWTSLNNENTFV